MKRHGRVVGRVIDAETKKPIERFFVSRKYVIDNDFLLFSNGRWQSISVADSPDGVFRCVCREGPRSRATESITLISLDGRKSVEVREPKYVGVLFKIEAEGYKPVTSKRLPWKEGEIEVAFEMKRAGPLVGRN